MAYRLEANLNFGFHDSLMNTFLQIFNKASLNVNVLGEGENTLRRLALFLYLDHPTKNDVTSGKKAEWAAKSNLNMAESFSQ